MILPSDLLLPFPFPCHVRYRPARRLPADGGPALNRLHVAVACRTRLLPDGELVAELRLHGESTWRDTRHFSLEPVLCPN